MQFLVLLRVAITVTLMLCCLMIKFHNNVTLRLAATVNTCHRTASELYIEYMLEKKN